MSNTNLPDYIRTELQNCQNIKEIASLVAVVKYLGAVRGRELGYTQTKIASQLGVIKQRISFILAHPKGDQ